VTSLVDFIAKQTKPQKVEFIFDVQMGQMDSVLESWDKLIDTGPPNVTAILQIPPIFRQSKLNMPLQAADLCVGWTREQAEAEIEGRQCRPVPWGSTGDKLRLIGRFWTPRLLEEMRQALVKKNS
jgi:hypothetical protein